MSYTPYGNMSFLLIDQQSFKGNSVTARRHGDRYLVYSYNALMYSEPLRGGNGLTYFDYTYHSVTTSKIQSLIARVFDWDAFVDDPDNGIRRPRKHMIIPRVRYIIDGDTCKEFSKIDVDVDEYNGSVVGDLIKRYDGSVFEF